MTMPAASHDRIAGAIDSDIGISRFGCEEWTMDKQRFLYIDNLRILLITIVIGIHLSITYGGGGGWYYKEVPQPDLFSV